MLMLVSFNLLCKQYVFITWNLEVTHLFMEKNSLPLSRERRQVIIVLCSRLLSIRVYRN